MPIQYYLPRVANPYGFARIDMFFLPQIRAYLKSFLKLRFFFWKIFSKKSGPPKIGIYGTQVGPKVTVVKIIQRHSLRMCLKQVDW